MGEQSFVIEVIDELKPVDDPAHDYRDDLKALEAMWLEKLIASLSGMRAEKICSGFWEAFP